MREDLASGPNMTRYQLSNLKVILIITERMVDSSRHLRIQEIILCHLINLSNLQPADKKDKLEDEKYWEENFRFRVELLVPNQR